MCNLLEIIQLVNGSDQAGTRVSVTLKSASYTPPLHCPQGLGRRMRTEGPASELVSVISSAIPGGGEEEHYSSCLNTEDAELRGLSGGPKQVGM